ncbi:MAG: hypothetical protein A3H97_06400 [Acidobacteria bacterium RIFCSPLOWO2_02_FULL_65_29]|nr:MAG: hypothetical protein A3H97_06400 [Acidobacteria bacterium RIFCSPLOWO2_02_FULL_65_29]
MHYVLLYDVVDDMVTKRAPYREEHLRLIREGHARGEIVMAGAVGDPVDGALLIFRADSPQVAERFAAADPYVKQGLVIRWKVKPWTVVAGA